MYTRATLDELFKTFHEEALKDGYKEPTKPLFNDDGSFNEKNWQSNQDVVRDELFDTICPGNTFHKDFEHAAGFINAHVLFIGDQWYVLITHNQDDNKFTSYVLTWYKNRGKTDGIYKNGELVNIDEYITMLNLLEENGFLVSDNWKW